MTSPQARILVVDDDVDTCRNLADILSDLGYQVDTAHDGPSALQLVRQTPYDVALLDYKMPGMDGVTLYREIKKLRAGTAAIIVTAYASSATADDALTAGARHVLNKPVDFPRLLSLVNEAAGEPLVLVVDDDHDLCMSLCDVLHVRGYRVCVAHDEREAEKQLKDSTFKAVLIDMKLPSGDGHSVFRLARQTDPQARVIVITGHRAELEPQVQAMLTEGADAVCYKPFDIPTLIANLERATRAHSDLKPVSGVDSG